MFAWVHLKPAALIAALGRMPEPATPAGRQAAGPQHQPPVRLVPPQPAAEAGGED